MRVVLNCNISLDIASLFLLRYRSAHESNDLAQPEMRHLA